MIGELIKSANIDIEDLRKMLNRASEGYWAYSGNWKTCIDCGCAYQGHSSYLETHTATCSVVLARKLKKEIDKL